MYAFAANANDGRLRQFAKEQIPKVASFSEFLDKLHEKQRSLAPQRKASDIKAVNAKEDEDEEDATVAAAKAKPFKGKGKGKGKGKPFAPRADKGDNDQTRCAWCGRFNHGIAECMQKKRYETINAAAAAEANRHVSENF